MRLFHWPIVQRLRELLRETAPSPTEMAGRLQSVERNVILPVKAAFLLILLNYFFSSRWFVDLALPQSVAQIVVERFFIIYLIFTLAAAFILMLSRWLKLLLVQWVIFVASFVDSLFLAALTIVTGGFDSILYWLFMALIARNALSSPLAVPQIVLNLSVCLCYVAAGILDIVVADEMLDFDPVNRGATENSAEPFILRIIVLLLTAACCYGLQVLLAKQRRAADEAREFHARQQQLSAAGRLAAKIAHQIKNPLAIINNAGYSLHRAVQEGKGDPLAQVQIIREEVARADKIITKLMGYAQLAEGKVERLDVAEELDRALAEVFPAGAKYEVRVEKDYAPRLPPLFMQRGHLSEILVNLLQNAREAMAGRGHLAMRARLTPDEAVQISIRDDGPGIPPSKIERIFEPYFSTKQGGSGLGLSIVKHNVEIYGGTVRIESELGKGAEFVLHFPTRTFMKLQS